MPRGKPRRARRSAPCWRRWRRGPGARPPGPRLPPRRWAPPLRRPAGCSPPWRCLPACAGACTQSPAPGRGGGARASLNTRSRCTRCQPLCAAAAADEAAGTAPDEHQPQGQHATPGRSPQRERTCTSVVRLRSAARPSATLRALAASIASSAGSCCSRRSASKVPVPSVSRAMICGAGRREGAHPGAWAGARRQSTCTAGRPLLRSNQAQGQQRLCSTALVPSRCPCCEVRRQRPWTCSGGMSILPPRRTSSL